MLNVILAITKNKYKGEAMERVSNTIRFYLILCTGMLFFLCLNTVAAKPPGQVEDYLAGSHMQQGLECDSCHASTTPVVNDNEKVENQNCINCHARHTESTVYCSNCHAFDDMKISHNQGLKSSFLKNAIEDFEKATPNKTEQTDVLVIGSGAAGFSAAIMATDKGAKVIVVEKMPVPGGNSQLAAGGMNAAGSQFQKEKGITDNPELMFSDTMKGGKEQNNPELVKILADRSADSIAWLSSKGIVLNNIGRGGGASATRMHGSSGGAFVGPYMSAKFRTLIENNQVDLRVNSQAVRLISDEKGTVTGALIKGKHSGVYQISAKAVVLATGGFGANKDMVDSFRPEIRETATSNQPGTQGEGVIMGENIGADTVDLKEIQLNPTMLVGSPVIVSEIVRGAGAIFVNRDGKRFFTELGTRDATSAAILAQKGGSVYMIFDQKVRDNVKQTGAFFELQKVQEADTIGELAAKIGVDPATLTATVERYNGFVEKKSDPDFNRTDFPGKVDSAKFYAIEVKPAIHFTMGGLKINENTQVINKKGDVIPGLYAAGEVSGGVHGANRLGGNSISETITFGLIAGEQAALLAASR